MELSFYRGKRVLVTGHTGFKGMWLCQILEMAGAELAGYALDAPTEEGAKIFRQAGIEKNMRAVRGDVRDLDSLRKLFREFRPEIVLHLAAQPIVLESYRDPVGTYATNVMGTVNVLECVRQTDSVKSVLNVTTDKVYLNEEWCWGYRENDRLDGFDPYSNSKSCSELVTHSYQRSFLEKQGIAVSTARAGNVIGGGDFAPNRIIPDCIRAAAAGVPIEVRNPHSIRPYQHVLEPLSAYLMIAESQYKNLAVAGNYNIGPEDSDCVTTGELADIFCKAWGNGMSWKAVSVEAAHEAHFLRLDCSKIKHVLGWKPRWHIREAVAKTVEWAKAYQTGEPLPEIMNRQTLEYLHQGEEHSCHEKHISNEV